MVLPLTIISLRMTALIFFKPSLKTVQMLKQVLSFYHKVAGQEVSLHKLEWCFSSNPFFRLIQQFHRILPLIMNLGFGCACHEYPL